MLRNEWPEYNRTNTNPLNNNVSAIRGFSLNSFGWIRGCVSFRNN